MFNLLVIFIKEITFYIFRGGHHFENTCFNTMFCGSTFNRKPKRDRTRKTKDQAEPTAPKKKKGFLPETKKRKNRKKQLPVSEQGAADANTVPSGKPEGGKKKRNKIKRKLPGGGETPVQGPTKKAKTT